MNVKKTEGRTPETGTPASTIPSGTPSGFLGLRDDFDRLFDSMMLSPFGRRLAVFDPFRREGLWGATKGGALMPRMDVVEHEKSFQITAELPGVAEADIDVSIADGMLTIHGEKKAETEDKTGDYRLCERSWGDFTRSFSLPEMADEDHVTASFDKGVLTLTVPKLDRPAPARRKIEVKTTH